MDKGKLLKLMLDISRSIFIVLAKHGRHARNPICASDNQQKEPGAEEPLGIWLTLN